MSRPAALLPEVAGSGHNSLTEMSQPDTIHKHSSGQWRRICCDGLSELQATAALVRLGMPRWRVFRTVATLFRLTDKAVWD
jgi:hypothetical protein